MHLRGICTHNNTEFYLINTSDVNHVFVYRDKAKERTKRTVSDKCNGMSFLYSNWYHNIQIQIIRRQTQTTLRYICKIVI